MELDVQALATDIGRSPAYLLALNWWRITLRCLCIKIDLLVFGAWASPIGARWS